LKKKSNHSESGVDAGLHVTRLSPPESKVLQLLFRLSSIQHHRFRVPKNNQRLVFCQPKCWGGVVNNLEALGSFDSTSRLHQPSGQPRSVFLGCLVDLILSIFFGGHGHLVMAMLQPE